jgi:hypothetical protein
MKNTGLNFRLINPRVSKPNKLNEQEITTTKFNRKTALTLEINLYCLMKRILGLDIGNLDLTLAPYSTSKNRQILILINDLLYSKINQLKFRTGPIRI